MQFLKILFWFLLAFVAALFTYGNWSSVQINLWSGLIADVNLPFLLLVTFLIPVSAILLGALVLGEVLLPRHFAGMALVGAGLAFIDGRLPRSLLARRRMGEAA